ncbi:MAG TPA: type II secretion system F family protein [Acidimicrobiales bacterium]
MSSIGDPLVLALVAGVVGGVGVLAWVLLELSRARSAAVAERIPEAARSRSGRGDRRTRRLDDALAASPALRRAVEVTADLASRKGALGSVERSLRAADVPVRPAELILLHALMTVVVPVATFLVTRSSTNTLLALVVAALGPPFALKVLTSSRRKRFNAQLPDALTTLSGALRSGRSLGQAMESLSREMADPMGRELRKVVAEVRLGRTLHDTLSDAAERIGSEDFRWAVLAMQIQAEVGGNLAELLDQVASTMRERSRMRGEVKALTAEGRASALMLVVMVPALGLAMKVLNPTYMEPMFTTSTGRILLGVSAVMIVGGYVWMNSMVKIDV